jgi:hypothetical protein
MTERDGTVSEAPQQLRMSAMAVASFVLGLASLALFAVPVLSWPLSILAIVFGHTGRREIKRGLKSGWGYDIAGLIFGYVVLVILLVAVFARN